MSFLRATQLVLLVGIACSAAQLLKFESAKDLQQSIDSSNLLIVEFLAPWCGKCREMQPHVEQFGEYVAARDVFVAQLDCTLPTNRQTCEVQYKIPGYPMFLAFSEGVYLDNFSDKYYSFQGLKTWYKKLLAGPHYLGPKPLTISNQKVFENFVARVSDQPLVVGFFRSKIQPEYKEFRSLVKELENKFTFAQCASANCLDGHPDLPAVTLHVNSSIEDFYRFDGPKITSQNLKGWIVSLTAPPVSEFTPAFKPVDGLPYLVVFYDASDDAQQATIVDTLTRLHPLTRSRLLMMKGASDKFKMLMGPLYQRKQPTAMIRGKKTRFLMETDFSEENVKKFIEDFLATLPSPKTKEEL